MVSHDLLELAVHAAIRSGREIMRIYDGPGIAVSYKSDKSPVTEADTAASEVIRNLLTATYPIISEEDQVPPYHERKDWQYTWMVDPLDGTREFIKRNGEFTVNIALIENKSPVLGVIYAPAKRKLYYGLKGEGAFRIEEVGEGEFLADYQPEKISVRKIVGEKIVIAASRSHMDKETEAFINNKTKEFRGSAIVGAGSSLKMCMVAEGTAHIYPRFGTTMEWDTAAGQAIAEAAGALMVSYPEGKPLLYNKEDLRNPSFVVSGL